MWNVGCVMGCHGLMKACRNVKKNGGVYEDRNWFASNSAKYEQKRTNREGASAHCSSPTPTERPGPRQPFLKIRLLPLGQKLFLWKQSKHTLITPGSPLTLTPVSYDTGKCMRNDSSWGCAPCPQHGLNTELEGKRGCCDWNKMMRGKEKQMCECVWV